MLDEKLLRLKFNSLRLSRIHIMERIMIRKSFPLRNFTNLVFYTKDYLSESKQMKDYYH